MFAGCKIQHWWAKNPWFQKTIYPVKNFLYIASYSVWFQGSKSSADAFMVKCKFSQKKTSLQNK